MLVSVIMAMRNAEPYVRQALASVLQETEVPLEVVVVDDGSTDRSRAIVQGIGDPRVRIVDGPRRGVSASINTGLAAARGDIIMKCDADDLYPPGRIGDQVAWLYAHPEHDAVCGAFSTIDSGGRAVADLCVRAEDLSAQEISSELRSGTTRTSLCTYAIRRSALSAVGLHRDYFETSSDIDLQLRLGEACRVAYLPENTYFYRLHDASITHTQGNARRVFYENTVREFQRQRLATGTDDLAAGHPPVPPASHGDAPGQVASQIQGMLLGEAWRELAKGHRRAAAAKAWRAVVANPSSRATWISAIKLGVRVILSTSSDGHHVDRK
ncbi:MAG TPA: glycosyltransferase family A protein [Burkholderiaceae bacterium]